MTQQDIINELNRLVVGYNITWDSVKYDADKAIVKINSYLGAEYPMMSEILLSPNHRYTVKYKGTDLPIFPERYILTVVIPYIATEVLARDEEFTTIYNKYAMDFENGLFDMVQNEYNKVPRVFRQDPDVGVFFSRESMAYEEHHHPRFKVPEITYNVHYHYNVDFEMPKVPVDTHEYDYNSNIVCMDSNIHEFVRDLYAYKFIGWMLDTNGDVVFLPGQEINIKSDLHLYALWSKTCILEVDSAGFVSIVPKYAADVRELTIPPIVNSARVKGIPMYFDKGTTQLVSVTLPRTDLTIRSYAFTKGTIRNLVLPTFDYLRNKPNISIESFGINCTGVDCLYIPYSVHGIANLGVQGVQQIQCEIESPLTTWNESWTNVSEVDWGVVHG